MINEHNYTNSKILSVLLTIWINMISSIYTLFTNVLCGYILYQDTIEESFISFVLERIS